MGPTRTNKGRRHNDASNEAGPSKSRQRRNHRPDKESTGAPGVQKIKSSLRQARRLLARDNLAADVRVETERRLKALEADLIQAELSKKERTLAIRYHKIKFFERQKVVRKLNQTKKQLETADADSKSRLKSLLSELRVDLNYILHYPKTKKYVSLFPPEIRHAEDKGAIRTEDETCKGSEEVRNWIEQQMDSGELSSEPELHLDEKRGSGPKSSQGRWTNKNDQSTSPITPHNLKDKDVEEDTFFGDDVDDESDG